MGERTSRLRRLSHRHGRTGTTVTEITTYDLPTWAPLPARADPVFDELAQRAARELQGTRALVVLVSKSGQVYPGAFGLPEPWNTRRSMPLSHSLSLPVAGEGRPMIVRDAREDAELRSGFAVREMAVVAFAAMPLENVHGHPIGVLSVCDDRPRDWTPQELTALRRLAEEASARLAVQALELAEREARAAADRADEAARRAAETASAALVAAEAEADRARLVARLSQQLLPAQTIPDVLRAVDRFARSPLGAVVVALGVADTGSPDVRVWAVPGGSPGSGFHVAVLPLAAAHPLATTVRERTRVPTRGDLPGPAPSVLGGPETSLAVPVALGQYAGAGGLQVGWAERRQLDPGLYAVVADLARHVGHALDRVLLREQRLGLLESGAPLPGTA